MTEKRIGDWMRTYGGGRFWPLDPRPEDVDLKDIVHHLANTCRFSGASPFFYNVADHSRLVSYLAPPHLKVAGLIHDFAEAYVGDQIRPIKQFMAFSVPNLIYDEPFKDTEDRVLDAIIAKLSLWSAVLSDQLRAVKYYDDLALAIEAKEFGWDTSEWVKMPIPASTDHLLHIEHIPDSEVALWRACEDLGIVR